MKIETIKIEGTARDQDLTLTPGLVVIAGPNGSGKSTIANMVRWILTGSIPGVGTQNNRIMQYAMGDRLAVELGTSTGTYSAELRRDGANVKKRAGRGQVIMPTEYLDAGEFFAKTPARQIETLASIFGGKVDAEQSESIRTLALEAGVHGSIDSLAAVENMAQATKETRSDVRKERRTMEDFVQEMHVGVIPPPEKLQLLDKKRREADAEVERLVKEIALANQARHLADPPKMDEGAIALEIQECTDRLAQLQAKATEAKTELATLADLEGEAEDAANVRRACDKSLEDLRERLKETSACPTCGSKAKASIERLTKGLNEEIEETERELATAKSEADQAAERLEKFSKEVKSSDEQVAELECLCEAEEEAISDLRHDQQRWKRMEGMAEKVRSPEEITAMNKSLEEWRERKEAAAQELRDATLARDTSKRLEKSRERLEELARRDKALIALTGAIEHAREAMVNNAVGEALTLVAPFAEVFGADFRFSSSDGFVLIRGAHSIPFSTMSGAEQSLIAASFGAAIGRTKFLLIDECARFDSDRMEELVRTIRRMITEELIEQAILIGTGLDDMILESEYDQLVITGENGSA